MEKAQFSDRDILAGRAPKESQTTVKGWVRTRRDSKAGISFIHVYDGSSLNPMQVVAPTRTPLQYCVWTPAHGLPPRFWKNDAR